MKKVEMFETTQEGFRAGKGMESLGTFHTQPRASEPKGRESHVWNLYPDMHYQSLTGIGGAATESAAWCWAQLDEMGREQFIRDYFDPEEGIGYNFLRIHIAASDFSLSPYHHIEEGDVELKTFSLDRDREYVIPFLKAVQEKYPFTLFASPWSPLPFMKDNNNIVGGRLLPEYYDAWARYIARFVEEYRKEGLFIERITLQNEPWHVGSWETCGFTNEEERDFAKVVAKYLVPLGVKIFFWDHNRQDILRAARTMYDNEENRRNVAGLAYHLYSGTNFDEIRLFREAYPDKEIFFSEGCCYDEEKGVKTENAWNFAEKYAYELANNLNAGASGFVDWNLILDQDNGPSNLREGRTKQCDAPLRLLQDGSVLKTPSYYYIGHFSRFLKPGAVRIAQSVYHENLVTTAFQNPDGSIAAVVMNRGEEARPVQVVLGDQYLRFELLPHAIRSLLIQP